MPIVPVLLLAGACSGGDDGPQPLDRIDGPAQIDPEFLEDNGSDGRSDSGG